MGKFKKKVEKKIIIREDGSVQIAEFMKKKLHGKSIVMIENRVDAISEFKNGNLHGTSTLFTEEGFIKEVCNFKNAVKHGNCVSFSPSRKTTVVSRFVNGTMTDYDIYKVVNITNNVETVNFEIMDLYVS